MYTYKTLSPHHISVTFMLTVGSSIQSRDPFFVSFIVKTQKSELLLQVLWHYTKYNDMTCDGRTEFRSVVTCRLSVPISQCKSNMKKPYGKP